MENKYRQFLRVQSSGTFTGSIALPATSSSCRTIIDNFTGTSRCQLHHQVPTSTIYRNIALPTALPIIPTRYTYSIVLTNCVIKFSGTTALPTTALSSSAISSHTSISSTALVKKQPTLEWKEHPGFKVSRRRS